jgi:hypothetical protein
MSMVHTPVEIDGSRPLPHRLRMLLFATAFLCLGLWAIAMLDVYNLSAWDDLPDLIGSNLPLRS